MNRIPRLYLAQDPAAHLRADATPFQDCDYSVVPAPAGIPDDLRSASLRLRVIGAAHGNTHTQPAFLDLADKHVLPHVPARRRSGFRAALTVLIGRGGDKAAACKKLLACPCIGTLSESLVRLLDQALERLGFRCTVYCLEGDKLENVHLLQTVRDTMHYDHFMVRVWMRPETFMSTSIQNWSHLQATICRV